MCDFVFYIYIYIFVIEDFVYNCWVEKLEIQ